jgi:hypothetical protein
MVGYVGCQGPVGLLYFSSLFFTDIASSFLAAFFWGK